AEIAGLDCLIECLFACDHFFHIAAERILIPFWNSNSTKNFLLIVLKDCHLGECLSVVFDATEEVVQPDDEAAVRRRGRKLGKTLQRVSESLASGDHRVNTKPLVGLAQQRPNVVFEDVIPKRNERCGAIINNEGRIRYQDRIDQSVEATLIDSALPEQLQ